MVEHGQKSRVRFSGERVGRWPSGRQEQHSAVLKSHEEQVARASGPLQLTLSSPDLPSADFWFSPPVGFKGNG